MNAATKIARKRHADGVARLNHLFHWDPAVVQAKRKHAKHDARWRLRKLAATARRRNRA